MVCKRQEQCKFGKMCGWAKDEETLLTECVEFIERVPLTNEEWFDGLSTEEKAKVLFILIENIKNGESVYTAIEKAIKDKDVKLPPITEHLFFREWLKQPHTVKE